MLLAGSYTFWTQAIIGEVYTLHLLLTGLVLSALLWWSERPSLRRLTVVYGVYALGFGNHLMMILLAPAIVLFVAITPGGVTQMLSPRGLAVAVVCAAAGASQYLWNAAPLFSDGTFPSLEAWRAFWFDVTKADWRATMVLKVHESAWPARRAMYLWDLRQQMGIPGIALAIAGATTLLVRQPRRFVLLAVAGVSAFAFAFTYNVGDVHVFFLPAHQIAIALATAGTALVLEVSRQARHPGLPLAATALMLTFPAARLVDTFPVVDRSSDRRPIELLDALTRGLGADTLFVADVNWQIDNGLDYYTRHVRPDLTHVRVRDVPLSLPFLVRDALARGRDVVMTAESRRLAEAAFGDLFAFTPDERAPAPSLPERLAAAAAGSADLLYVLAVLAPDPDLPFDRTELDGTLLQLTGGTARLEDSSAPFRVLAGRVGEPPRIDRCDRRPFRQWVRIGELTLDIHMLAWLPGDTIRRAGFGRVIAGRRPVLTLERGVSVVLLNPDGTVRTTAYASGLFAPVPRYRVSLTAPVRAW